MISLFPSRTVAIDLFGFAVHWYGIMYLCGFLLGYYLVVRLQKYRDITLSREEWANILSWCIIGVLVGGRLGYVLLYEPAYFLSNPIEILAVWKGGMASHGGFIGVSAALLFVLHRRGYPILKIADIVVIPVAIGLALGRVGNFINQELYGTITDVPWAMRFAGADGLRHPTQLYAIGKNLLIASACYWYLTHTTISYKRGRACALFLMLYGCLRYIVEYFREQEYYLLDIGFMELSRGQLLSLPIVIAGILLWWYSGHRAKS